MDDELRHALEAEWASPSGEVFDDTFDEIDSLALEVASARRRGTSRAAWLGTIFASSGDEEALDIGLEELPVASAAGVAEAVLGALREGVSRGLDGDFAPLPEFECASEALTSSFGSADERRAKRAVAGAMSRWLHAQGRSVSTPVIAAAADVGFTSAKAAYHIGAKGLAAEQAVELVEDRVVAAVAEVARKVLPDVGARAGQALGGKLGSLIGLAPVGAALGRNLGRAAGEFAAS